MGAGSLTGGGRRAGLRLPGTVTEVATSNSGGYALLSDGLGDGGSDVSSSVPVRVPLPGPAVPIVEGGSDAGNGQSLALLAGGLLYARGDDGWGQLGDGKTVNESSPVPVATPEDVTYRNLASGSQATYAVSAPGAVYAWGDGSNDQLGDGTTGTALAPVEIVPSGMASISATANDVAVSPAGAPDTGRAAPTTRVASPVMATDRGPVTRP